MWHEHLRSKLDMRSQVLKQDKKLYKYITSEITVTQLQVKQLKDKTNYNVDIPL